MAAGDTPNCWATKVTATSGVVPKSSGAKPRYRSAQSCSAKPSWLGAPRCLRTSWVSRSDKVKKTRRSSSGMGSGQWLSRSRSAAVRKSIGLAVLSHQTLLSSGTAGRYAVAREGRGLCLVLPSQKTTSQLPMRLRPL